jgi:outer membrane biosynthesis protein TonB
MQYYNPFITEKRNRSKSMRTSVILHTLLLLITFFYSFSTKVKDPDPEKPYKVTIDFTELKESSLSKYAHADVGEKRPKTEEIELLAPTKPMEIIREDVKVEIPKVTIPTPTPTPPVTSTTVVDEAPVQVIELEIEIEKPTTERIPEVVKETPKPSPPAPPTPSREPDSKPSGGPVTSNTPSTSSGTNTNPASRSDGSGTGKGNSGSGQGASSGSDNTSGSGQRLDGTGAYDGQGESIFGRKPIFRNWKALPKVKSGKVAVKICVDRQGKVGFAEILELESTITDPSTLKQILRAAYGYIYEVSTTAPAQQCGKLSFRLSDQTQALVPKK